MKRLVFPLVLALVAGCSLARKTTPPAAKIARRAVSVPRPPPQSDTPPKTITLAWDNPGDLDAGTVTEFWSSPDLSPGSWTLKTNVAGLPGNDPANRVTFNADQSAEFFAIRNRDASGAVSPWSADNSPP